MYEYDSKTKTLTLNEWGEIRLLPSEIRTEAEHLVYNDRRRLMFILLVASWNYACVN